MKKTIVIFMSLFLLLGGISVHAESTAQSVYNAEKSNATDQYFTTSGTIENNANGFVTIVATTDGTITTDSIMYIDQTVADANGAFTFTDYIPKTNLAQNQQYIVKIGATGLSAPISGGTLTLPAPAVNTYALSGKLAFVGAKTKATVKVMQGETLVKTIESAAGDFSVPNLPNGTYTLLINKISHLPNKTEAVVNDADKAIAETITLYPGEITGNTIVDIDDLTGLIDLYGSVESTSTNYRAVADLDENGIIDITDLTTLIDSYGKQYIE